MNYINFGEGNRAIEISSIMNRMAELEEFNGVIENKIYENWYALKRELAEIVLLPNQKGETKDGTKEI